MLYRKAYNNWKRVIFYRLLKRNIIEVNVREGKTFRAPKEIVYFLKELLSTQHYKTEREHIYFDQGTGIFTFGFNNFKVYLKCYEDGNLNGEFSSFLGHYKFLNPLQSNIIIDIGANIGDSAIYFAISGAKEVIALEPYKYNYIMGLENIKLNKLESNIKLLNGAYGLDGEVEIQDKISNISTTLEAYNGGVKIPVLSLETIIDRFNLINLDNLSIKMDCEGCEYNIIHEHNETLKKFEKIIVEYHNGYKDLLQKLENCNFTVQNIPLNLKQKKQQRERCAIGYLYASRKK